MADFNFSPKFEVTLPEKIPDYFWERIPIFSFIILVYSVPTFALQRFKNFFEENNIKSMVIALSVSQMIVLALFVFLVFYAVFKGYF